MKLEILCLCWTKTKIFQTDISFLIPTYLHFAVKVFHMPELFELFFFPKLESLWGQTVSINSI